MAESVMTRPSFFVSLNLDSCMPIHFLRRCSRQGSFPPGGRHHIFLLKTDLISSNAWRCVLLCVVNRKNLGQCRSACLSGDAVPKRGASSGVSDASWVRCSCLCF